MASKSFHKTQLQDRKYLNWVKGGLALKYLKDGIGYFADEVAKEVHSKILQTVGLSSVSSCSLCSLKTLKPPHAPKVKQCPIGQRHCNCLLSNTSSCQNNMCGLIYDEIVKSHGSLQPFWKNTDITKWTTHPWEIAKCFINVPGYDRIQSAKDTDVSGLLHLFINCTFFQGRVSSSVNLFDKIRAWRNSVFHSPSMELEDQQLTDGINDIITLLEDDKELKAKECSKQAVLNLKSLQQENFIITTETEAEACRAALESITLATNELKHIQDEVKKDIEFKKEEAQKYFDLKQEETLKNVKETAESGSTKLQVELFEIRKRVDIHDLEINVLQTRVKDIEIDVAKLQQAQDHQTKHLGEIERILNLKDGLMTYYRENESMIPAAPLVEEHKVPIEELYVLPPMWAYNKPLHFELDKNTQKGEHTPGKAHEKNETRFSQLFLSDKNVRYRKIYITAGAGFGKTSLSQKLTMTWCQSHTPLTSLTGTYKGEELAAMKCFDFLFLLHLRDYQSEPLCNLDDLLMQMLSNNLPRNTLYTKEFIQKLLHEKTCLVVLDGLDEWTHPDKCRRTPAVPHNNYPDSCTVLTTSRPWKLGTIGLSEHNIDRHIEISELDRSTRDKLENNAVRILNERNLNRAGKSIADFKTAVKSVQIGNIIYNPYILLQLMCVFFGGLPIGKSKCEIYSNITEFSLERGVNKRSLPDVQTNDNAPVPNCMNENETCKCYFILLMKLGKLAFYTLFSDKRESSLIFDRRIVAQYMTEQEIEFCLKVGLLCQTKDSSIIAVKRYHVFFQHKSVQEFFSAIYITSEWQNESVKLTILNVCSSLSGILEMSNVFVFVCGINPEVYTCISGELQTIVDLDSVTHRYRTDMYINYDDRRTLLAYQSMQVECFQESVRNGNENCLVYLQDILLTNYEITRDHLTPLKTIVNFNKTKIKSLYLKFRNNQQEKMTIFLQSLEPEVFISMETFRASFHDAPSPLAEIITNAPTLKYLYISSQDWSSDVTLDLTHLTKLTALRLANSHRNAQEISIRQLHISSDMQELECMAFKLINMSASGWKNLFHSISKIRQSVNLNVKECCGPSEKEWNELVDEMEKLEAHVTTLDSKVKERRSLKIQTNKGINLPAEILRMKDKDAIELYKKALNDGEEKVYNIRLMIVGHFGVGKTALTKRFLNKKFDITKRVSTEGIDLHIGKMTINLKNGEWLEHTTDAEADFLYRKGAVLAQHQHHVDDTSEWYDTDSSDSSSDDEINEAEKRDNTSLSATQNELSVTQASGQERSSVKSDEQLPPAVDKPQSDRKKIDKKLDETGPKYDDHKSQKHDMDEETKEKKGIEELQKIRSFPNFNKLSAEVSIWDFAGQYAFYDTHQVFMSWRTIYLLVTNLSKQSTDIVEDDDCYVDSIGKRKWKVSEFASFWLNAINECSAADKMDAELSETTPEISNETSQSLGPPVILVGTFSDTLEDKNEGAKRLEALSRFLKKNNCTASSNLVEKHFVIDNKSQIDSFGELRKTILELAKKQKYWGERVPARWIDMEIKLHEMKTRGIKILIKEDLVKMIEEKSLPIPTLNELNLFLKFHHEIGNIIHYSEDKILNKTIVLDPQWLINAFKRINLRQESYQTEHEIFKKNGILTESCLDEIWKKDWLDKLEKDDDEDRNKSGFVEHSKTIRAYLEKLGLFAKPHKDTKGFINMDEFFFVPSLLKETVPDRLLRPADKEITTRKLYFEAKSGFLPSAVFNKLLASCIASYPLMYDDDIKTYHLFCGYGQFYFKDEHKLSTLFNKNVIEIWLSRQNETPAKELFRQAEQFVADKIKTGSKQFKTVKPEDHTQNHWEEVLRTKNQDTQKIASLLEHSFPNKFQLDEALKIFERKSPIMQYICKMICDHIRKMYKSSDIINVWPAYTTSDPKHIVFVVETEIMADPEIALDLDIVLCKKGSQGSRVSENKMVIQHAIKTRTRMDLKTINHMKTIINKNSLSLREHHSNITIITASPFRSTGYMTDNHKMVKENCIVLFVPIKGFIPLQEEQFDERIDNFRIDVREGSFQFQIGGGPMMIHEDLKMGCAIGPSTEPRFGTLGGFVDHPEYGLCALTCGHVVLSVNEMQNESFAYNHRVCVQPNTGENGAKEIGKVVCFKFPPSKGACNVDLDVALIQIQMDRAPTSGHFPDFKDEDAISNIFLSGKDVEYSSGEICSDLDQCLYQPILKCGAKTSLRRGIYELDCLDIAADRSIVYSDPDLTMNFRNQIQINDDEECAFSDRGDSGSLVFMVKERKLFAIGILLGTGVDLGFSVVTPISAIISSIGINGNTLKVFKQKQHISDSNSIHERRWNSKIKSSDGQTLSNEHTQVSLDCSNGQSSLDDEDVIPDNWEDRYHETCIARVK